MQEVQVTVNDNAESVKALIAMREGLKAAAKE